MERGRGGGFGKAERQSLIVLKLAARNAKRGA